MTTDAYLAFVGLGLIMIVADGQILYHSGKRYLSDVDDETESVGSMAQLVAVLFHIVMFGFLALLSVLNFDFGGGNTLRAVVGNLGVLLLLLALVHAVTMAVISQLRDGRATDDRYAGPTPRTPTSTNVQLHRGQVVTPVDDQPGRDPRMTASLDDYPS
ncbi:hypothetical protein [Saccharomonospora iraqiensis]|uniref:hypothetical protein n=1 Tax=Saccharomonospora iraqiensis TaxID=52698 RepID=UPI0004126A48|nr:hypothetical protein [Saccharomonospora iraqiensis]